MRRLSMAGLVLMAASMPAFAQSATGVGVGVANSKSQSTAAATAIGGGNANSAAQGGNGGKAIINNTSSVPAVQTINSVASGTQTVRNVPTEFAPGLTSAGLETCLGSVSGGGAFVGTGFSFGSTIPDPGCAARLDARTMWAMGLRKAAIARLCQMSDIYNSMPEVCVIYLPPRPGTTGVAYASAEAPYLGGPIMLVEGKTGKDRMCNDYDDVKKRCRRWAH